MQHSLLTRCLSTNIIIPAYLIHRIECASLANWKSNVQNELTLPILAWYLGYHRSSLLRKRDLSGRRVASGSSTNSFLERIINSPARATTGHRWAEETRCSAVVCGVGSRLLANFSKSDSSASPPIERWEPVFGSLFYRRRAPSLVSFDPYSRRFTSFFCIDRTRLKRWKKLKRTFDCKRHRSPLLEKSNSRWISDWSKKRVTCVHVKKKKIGVQAIKRAEHKSDQWLGIYSVVA